MITNQTNAKKCGISFGEMLTKFKQKYPIYAKQIIDYRPSKFMNGITVWFYGGSSLSVTYDSNEDRFELLDYDNYTFYESEVTE